MLRQLKEKDAPLMLEWMHDTEINSCFEKDFSSLSLPDCNEFIRQSWSDTKNLHLAVVDQYDEYMGTVSLKNIREYNGWAEFAISMRKSAMGTGISREAMEDVIYVGKERYNLTHIYWNVLKSNARAIRFYDKNGFKKADDAELDIILNIGGGGVQSRIPQPSLLVLYLYLIYFQLFFFLKLGKEGKGIDPSTTI